MDCARDFSPQACIDDNLHGLPYIKGMTATKNPSEIARNAILEHMLIHVPFDGWTSKSLRRAVSDAELPVGAEELYFPGGELEVIKFWAEQSDLEAQNRLLSLDIDNMRIRDKVTAGVLARLEVIGMHEEAARRAISRLALPDALGQGAAQIWASADMIWRAIGDTSTDGNYYSKRAILSGVIGSSILAWLGDDTDEKTKSRAFLDARIQNVMQFEKAKWDFKKRTSEMPKPAEILGRLRYGRRRRRRSS